MFIALVTLLAECNDFTKYKQTYMTVLAKTHLVRTKTEFNFIAAVYRHTQYLSIPSVSSVKC